MAWMNKKTRGIVVGVGLSMTSLAFAQVPEAGVRTVIDHARIVLTGNAQRNELEKEFENLQKVLGADQMTEPERRDGLLAAAAILAKLERNVESKALLSKARDLEQTDSQLLRVNQLLQDNLVKLARESKKEEGDSKDLFAEAASIAAESAGILKRERRLSDQDKLMGVLALRDYANICGIGHKEDLAEQAWERLYLLQESEGGFIESAPMFKGVRLELVAAAGLSAAVRLGDPHLVEVWIDRLERSPGRELKTAWVLAGDLLMSADKNKVGQVCQRLLNEGMPDEAPRLRPMLAKVYEADQEFELAWPLYASSIEWYFDKLKEPVSAEERDRLLAERQIIWREFELNTKKSKGSDGQAELERARRWMK